MEPRIRRIAVVRPTGLGDLLLAVSMLRHLKKLYPQASVTVSADRRNAPLLPLLRCAERSVVSPTWGGNYAAILATTLRYRIARYDLEISARASLSRVLNLFLATLGTKRRLAVGADDWHSRLLTNPQPEAPHGRHQALKVRQLVAPDMNSVLKELRPRLSVPIRPDPLPGVRDPVLLTSVSNNRPHEVLPVEMHASILNAVADNRRLQFIVSCPPSNIERARSLVHRLRCPATVAPTSTMLPPLSLLRRSDLAFWAQGGLSHMAAAVNPPQVVLFGRTPPEEWAPLTDKARILFHPTDVGLISRESIRQSLLDRISASSSGPAR